MSKRKMLDTILIDEIISVLYDYYRLLEQKVISDSKIPSPTNSERKINEEEQDILVGINGLICELERKVEE